MNFIRITLSHYPVHSSHHVLYEIIIVSVEEVLYFTHLVTRKRLKNKRKKKRKHHKYAYRYSVMNNVKLHLGVAVSEGKTIVSRLKIKTINKRRGLISLLLENFRNSFQNTIRFYIAFNFPRVCPSVASSRQVDKKKKTKQNSYEKQRSSRLSDETVSSIGKSTFQTILRNLINDSCCFLRRYDKTKRIMSG